MKRSLPSHTKKTLEDLATSPHLQPMILSISSIETTPWYPAFSCFLHRSRHGGVAIVIFLIIGVVKSRRFVAVLVSFIVGNAVMVRHALIFTRGRSCCFASAEDIGMPRLIRVVRERLCCRGLVTMAEARCIRALVVGRTWADPSDIGRDRSLIAIRSIARCVRPFIPSVVGRYILGSTH